MNREQKIAWFTLGLVAYIVMAFSAVKYVLEPRFGSVAVAASRIVTIVIIAVGVYLIGIRKKIPAGTVEEDERSAEIAGQAHRWSLMLSLISVLAYGFAMVINYEGQGAEMPFEVFETIVSRQAVIAVAVLAIARSALILILYGKGSPE